MAEALAFQKYSCNVSVFNFISGRSILFIVSRNTAAASDPLEADVTPSGGDVVGKIGNVTECRLFVILLAPVSHKLYGCYRIRE